MIEEEIQQMNLERLRVYHELLNMAVWERYKLLPQISALAATLLVVATFNERILSLTNYVRFLLVAFLVLIPVSIIGYLVALHQAEKHAKKNIENISDCQSTKKMERGLFTAYLPWIIAGIFTILITQVIFLIF
ncbi:TPA: hypothetical protein DCZ57_00540 [Patescibacteria group bacterium]|nr:hypothetical protein [Patescibacteria group bacterium]